MTQQLHNLIDNGAGQAVINERIVGLMERDRADMAIIKTDLERIGSDHEKRIRSIEKRVSYTLGAIGAISAILWIGSILAKFLK